LPFTVTEDRNRLVIGRVFVVTFVWRPPVAVAGDRNGGIQWYWTEEAAANGRRLR
jgi:hypothetical protein